MDANESPHSDAELRRRVLELFADRRSVGREKLVLHLVLMPSSIAECKAILSAAEGDAFVAGAFDPPDMAEAPVH
jgi:hypothetical protein